MLYITFINCGKHVNAFSEFFERTKVEWTNDLILSFIERAWLHNLDHSNPCKEIHF